MPSPRHKGLDIEELMELHAEGWSVPELARHFKVAENTVRYHIRRQSK